MKFYYRISDQSYPKIKLPGATKKTCFENFITSFQPNNKDLNIIADNCTKDTIKWLTSVSNKQGFVLHQTCLGNSGSLLYALQQALEKSPENETFYFVEDDYLHDPQRTKTIIEDNCHFENEKHYWTLYDHPDKYTSLYGNHETCKVYKTNSHHWRTTISTTMTFFTTNKILEEDYNIWEEHLAHKTHPPDHQIFLNIKQKGRNLFVIIPGSSCHCDLTFSGFSGKLMIDQWAIDCIFNTIYKKIQNTTNGEKILKSFSLDANLQPNLQLLSKLVTIEEIVKKQEPVLI